MFQSYICLVSSSAGFFNLWRCGPTKATASSFLRILDQTQRCTTVGRTVLDDWSARSRDLSLTTYDKPSQEINIHAPSGIRFHNPSKRAAADPRFRPRRQWDRPPLTTGCFYFPSSHQIVLNFQICLSILLYVSHSLCNCQTLFQCFCRRCAVWISNISVIIHYWSFVLKLPHFEWFFRQMRGCSLLDSLEILSSIHSAQRHSLI
jgi:hypothetical protein